SLEWILTFLFTIEYLLRIYCVKNRWRYIFSFYGVIDLLSILPFYLGLVLPTSKYLASIRILRLLRIFRIFNLTRFTRGKNVLVLGLKESKDKIIVFLSFVVLIVVVIGSIMYMVEHDHPESGFTSIPISIYWAIVTLTTVGYGDISPVTGLGQFLASVVMIIGYGVIAVPTSIVTMEMNKAARHKEDIPTNTQRCRNCGDDYHLDGAIYCKTCGHLLNEP
ncbi:MAG TPA: ion transporter, partial [Flavobacteriaceae bacterium]|nr:ion transporter [Flavobacteriaceae bacterium]